MKLEEYQIMFEAEDTHWWYHGLRGVISTLLRLDKLAGQAPHFLDAGCGTGGTMQYLIRLGQRNVEGFDFSDAAVEFCRERGLTQVRQGSITNIPYPDAQYDFAISCDVLNDKGITDDFVAIQELYRVLRPGGRLFMNLPAFSFLHGEHDEATAILRRYTKRDIRMKLERAGFAIERLTYWNMLLFPVVLVVRLLSRRGLDKKGKDVRSDIVVPAAPVNRLLTGIVSFERLLLRRFDLPFGSSVAVVARKPRSG